MVGLRYRMCGCCCGFSLVEILVVVVIIAIAAMMAIPMAGSVSSTQIQSAANIIAADMEYTKSMAISKCQNYMVVFDKTTERYWITDQNGNVIAHPVKKGFNYIMDFRNESRLNEVDIVSASFNGTSTIKFDYLGSPYDGSGNPLSSGVVTLRAGGKTTTVVVEPITGFISITN
jgi:prepilin-type N-terminal cleavage/methylation domain-containing protein